MDSSSQADSRSSQNSLSQRSWESINGDSVEPTPELPVSQEDEEYNMNHKKRGRAYVFNQETFIAPGLSTRVGTVKDTERLEKVLPRLGFEVEVVNNRNLSDIFAKLDQIRRDKHHDEDCLMVVFLTHGESDGSIWARDAPFNLKSALEYFLGNRCRSLAGKPKIFIVQACRGHTDAVGTRIRLRTTSTASESSPNEFEAMDQTDATFDPRMETVTIPAHADFITFYSTVEGSVSYRTEHGTPFIQTLCNVLEERSQNTDLLSMSAIVNRKLCYALEVQTENAAKKMRLEGLNQCACVTHMLTRKVFLRPNVNIMD